MNNWKKVFAIIWTGQFFSILTSSLVNFAIILWLTFETKSAETLAFATIAAMLPQGILGMFSGVFIDRWSRKKIMILSDSFIAFCTLILALLFRTSGSLANLSIVGTTIDRFGFPCSFNASIYPVTRSRISIITDRWDQPDDQFCL